MSTVVFSVAHLPLHEVGGLGENTRKLKKSSSLMCGFHFNVSCQFSSASPCLRFPLDIDFLNVKWPGSVADTVTYSVLLRYTLYHGL